MTTTSTRTRKASNGEADALGEALTNDAEFTVVASAPYTVTVTLEGTCPIMFHRWSCEDVEAKGKAAKGSAAKKTDNVESYVYRCGDGTIGIPGTYLQGAITNKQKGAAKYRQDPRSPRKSALDLYTAGVVPLTECASLGFDKWDYLDKRRVVVQGSGITRVRPVFLAGWQAEFDLQVQLPEYIASADLLSVLTDAGKLVGLAEMRPTYGRFQIVQFVVQQ